MRNILVGLAAMTAAGLGGAAAPAQTPPDRVEVVYHPGIMFFSVEDGGQGRFKTGEDEDYTFPVTHEDYVRIRDLLASYRETGLVCGEEVAWEHNGYLVWREEGVETRRPHEATCYTPTHHERGRNITRAYTAVEEMAETRWVAPPLPILPDPDRLTLTWRSWGRVTETWTTPRGDEGRHEAPGMETRSFPVSVDEFDRLRDLFRAYEGVRFECDRIITDGPYGDLTWSQQGHEDQQLRWDAGCVSGDAADVFRRVDEAEAMLRALRDR